MEADDGALAVLLRDAERATLVKQGAEAKVYRLALYARVHGLTFPGVPAADTSVTTEWILLKHRFLKRYRHPSLSASITVARTVSEARALVRCARTGVHVPRVVLVDETRGMLGLEWIDGTSVRQWLGGLPEDGEEAPISNAVCAYTEARALGVMDQIGAQLAQMHCADVIHGDLTTSNMMLRTGPSLALVLIDFGLASTSSFWEEKAVDLYVLERAFASTHPGSQPLFDRILASYAHHTDRLTTPVKGGKAQGAWHHIHTRLQEVRLRGRKRSMVG